MWKGDIFKEIMERILERFPERILEGIPGIINENTPRDIRESLKKKARKYPGGILGDILKRIPVELNGRISGGIK